MLGILADTSLFLKEFMHFYLKSLLCKFFESQNVVLVVADIVVGAETSIAPPLECKAHAAATTITARATTTAK